MQMKNRKDTLGFGLEMEEISSSGLSGIMSDTQSSARVIMLRGIAGMHGPSGTNMAEIDPSMDMP